MRQTTRVLPLHMELHDSAYTACIRKPKDVPRCRSMLQCRRDMLTTAVLVWRSQNTAHLHMWPAAAAQLMAVSCYAVLLLLEPACRTVINRLVTPIRCKPNLRAASALVRRAMQVPTARLQPAYQFQGKHHATCCICSSCMDGRAAAFLLVQATALLKANAHLSSGPATCTLPNSFCTALGRIRCSVPLLSSSRCRMR